MTEAEWSIARGHFTAVVLDRNTSRSRSPKAYNCVDSCRKPFNGCSYARFELVPSKWFLVAMLTTVAPDFL